MRWPPRRSVPGIRFLASASYASGSLITTIVVIILLSTPGSGGRDGIGRGAGRERGPVAHGPAGPAAGERAVIGVVQRDRRRVRTGGGRPRGLGHGADVGERRAVLCRGGGARVRR